MRLRSVLIDTDISMGLDGAEIDDGAAIIALCRDPAVRVECVTTVFGNATVKTATTVAEDLLACLSVSVPVVQGAECPLEEGEVFTPPWEPAESLEGGNPSTTAAEAIIEQAEATPGLVIVALGPLTNLALAAHMSSGVVGNIGHVYAMGGNSHQTGEFNFNADRAAVRTTLSAGWPITLFGLDITNQATFTPEWFADLPHSDPALDGLRASAPRWIEEVERNGWHEGGCALHDAVPAVYVTNPEIAEVVPADRQQLAERGLHPDTRDIHVAVALRSTIFVDRLTRLLRGTSSRRSAAENNRPG